MLKNISDRYKTYKRLYKNYLVVMFKIILKPKTRDQITIILKNGIKKKWDVDTIILYNYLSNNPDISSIDIDNDLVMFKYNDISLKFNSTELGDIAEVFGLETYKPLITNCQDYVVIDIGGNIGDSAIFFAVSGAKKVIALEPFPYSYNIALENIRMNNLENKIIYINGGYGKGSIMIDEKFRNKVGTSIFESKIGKKIPLYSLYDLIEKYKISKFILKIDCEGCEYNLKNEEESIFDNILRIQIEYHYGLNFFPDLLSDSNYEVHFTKPKKEKNYDAINSNMSVGWLYAFKKE